MRARLLVAHSAADIPDQSAALVERNVVDGPAAIADGAQDQPALDLLALTRWHRPKSTAPVGLDPVARERKRRDRSVVAVAQQGDGGAQKPQADAVGLTPRLARCKLAQQLHIAPGRRVGLLSEPTRAVLVELQLGGVDVNVGPRELSQLAELWIRERRLRRSSTAEQDDLLDLCPLELRQGVIGGIRPGQFSRLEYEHAGDVDRDVAVADHHGPPGGQIEPLVGGFGVAVVPGDEPGRRI